MDKVQLMTSGEAAQVLGVTDERVRQLDSALMPVRTTGGQRIYLSAVVSAVAEQRAARRAP
jgi:hypothetical protein